ncbi:TRAP transporter small permease [Humitalea sp. 24SJ18S-53]|uniref:TRAP transporter small permease n=1 Tax=Humitalea sp. 24SJ18S-53 TaxID=3422307 RepID=UPI003D67F60F
MKPLASAVAALSRLAGAIGSVATVTCLLLIGWSVVARYVFGQPQGWIDKVAGWLVVALVLLAAPEAQRRFEHIGVDIAVGRIGPAWARAARIAGAVSVAVVAAILFFAGLEAVEFSRMVGLMTDIEGVPEWWIQVILPVGAAVLFLVAVVQAIVLVTGGTPDFQPDDEPDFTHDSLTSRE